MDILFTKRNIHKIRHDILTSYISIVLVYNLFDIKLFESLPFSVFLLTVVSEGYTDSVNSLCTNAVVFQ